MSTITPIQQTPNEKMEQARRYWLNKLSSVQEPRQFPLDFIEHQDQDKGRDSIEFVITSRIFQELSALTKNSSFLLYAVLLTSVKICLYKYNGNVSQVVGSPIRKKDGEILELTEILAVVDHLNDSLTFKECLLNVRQTLVEAYERQQYPFSLAIEELQREHSQVCYPELDVLVALKNIHSGASLENDIVLVFEKDVDLIKGNICFEAALFRRESIERFKDHVINVLNVGLQNKDILIRDLDILSEAERKQLLIDFSSGSPGTCHDRLVHELFEDRAARTPDAVALCDEQQQISYADLNQRANRLAHHLRRLGIRTESLVSVLLERDSDLIVAVLAVLKAGGAYVPLDLSWPPERLAYILENSQTACLLTHSSLLERLPGLNSKLICLDIEQQRIDQESAENPFSESTPESLAYVIYTSGSTGNPKGVCISHRAIASRAAAMNHSFDMACTDRLLQFLPPSADSFGEEIYPVLTSGATMVMRREPGALPASDFLDLVYREAVTILHFPAAYWSQLAEEVISGNKRVPDSVRLVICGGEAVTPDKVLNWMRRSFIHSKVMNAYGPTEATITTTLYDASPDLLAHMPRLPIGRPLPDTQLYVLNRHYQPVPIGIPGELYIAGVGLARCYLNQGDQTAEKFIPHPFDDKESRLYQTGDRVRWLRDGNLEFLDRIDEQVKLRGHRIELSEIEAMLNQYPQIQQSAVVIQENGTGDKRLVSFLVPRHAASQSETSLELTPLGNGPVAELGLTADGLRGYLQNRLPEYMTPTLFMIVDQLPITSNGKIDRRALTRTEGKALESGTRFITPRDRVETHLKQIWEEILGVDNVGIRDHFFGVGGHSLKAVALAARLEQSYGTKVAVRAIFERPTIELLASLIRQKASIVPVSSVVPLKQRGSRRPLFCAHPGGGLVQIYSGLASYMHPERPMYGLQSYGLEEGQTALRRIEDMAAQYIKDIRAIQPEGPYQIGGVSMGCVVAYEMAQQLVNAGERVSFLMLLDGSYSTNKIELSPEEWDEELAEWEQEYPIKRALGDIGMSEDAMRQIPESERLALYLEKAKELDKAPRDITIAQFQRFVRVFGINVLALRQYCPKPYPGRATLIRSDVSANNDETLGWGNLILGGLDVHAFAGKHACFLREPYISQVVNILEKGMAESEAMTTPLYVPA